MRSSTSKSSTVSSRKSSGDRRNIVTDTSRDFSQEVNLLRRIRAEGWIPMLRPPSCRECLANAVHRLGIISPSSILRTCSLGDRDRSSVGTPTLRIRSLGSYSRWSIPGIYIELIPSLVFCRYYASDVLKIVFHLKSSRLKHVSVEIRDEIFRIFQLKVFYKFLYSYSFEWK